MKLPQNQSHREKFHSRAGLYYLENDSDISDINVYSLRSDYSKAIFKGMKKDD